MNPEGPPMTINLRSEHERVLLEAISSGLAQTSDDALDQAFDALLVRLSQQALSAQESTAAAVRRLATFGKRHGLSLGRMTVKQLLRESRP
jgi:hypothetical protein